jgi:hypothetical protein
VAGRLITLCFATALLLSSMAVPAHAALRPGMLFLDAVPDAPAMLQQGSDECVTCHVIDWAGGDAVYGGDVAAYEQPSNHSHSGATTPCLSCHVHHGEPGMGGALAGKLLRVRPYQKEVVRDLAGGDEGAITNGTARADGWDPREIQLTAFCTSCHPAYSSSPTEDIGVPQRAEDGSIVIRYHRHHPLRPVRESRPYRTSRYGTLRIAAASTTGCTSCHGAGVGTAAFPHSTLGSACFLLAAANANSPQIPAVTERVDGVCLRCHEWKDEEGRLHGVGFDF